MANMEQELKERIEIMNYCLNNVEKLDVLDQLEITKLFFDFTDKLKPIYARNICKDDGVDTFFMKL